MSCYVNDININAASSYLELCATAPLSEDGVIEGNLSKAWQTINNPKYKKILVSISGGSDSDILIDICTRCDISLKCIYVWFNTGLEYAATIEHLEYLEHKYQIKIRRERAIKPIPVACKEYGQPFCNKKASEYIYRLQKIGFEWKDEPHEVLIKRYCRTPSAKKKAIFEENYQKYGIVPKHWARLYGDFYSGAVSAINWWCNYSYDGSQCNIANNKWLKEFMIANPPNFDISAKCCEYAKKKVAEKIVKKENFDLTITGIRKTEGGARAQAYHSCFSEGTEKKVDNYRPIFWYTNEDKKVYDKAYEITHSRCYSDYGLCRTGCVGCPCAKSATAKELEVVKKYEPMLYAATQFTFGDSYAYEEEYRKFAKKMKEKSRLKQVSENIYEEKSGQLKLVM